MAITPLPLEYLTSKGNVSVSVAQTKMESGSDIHRITLGFDPIIEKRTFEWVAPPAYIADLYQMFCVRDHLVGIYSITDEVMGESHWQPDGDLSWSLNAMARWSATLPMRRV